MGVKLQNFHLATLTEHWRAFAAGADGQEEQLKKMLQ